MASGVLFVVATPIGNLDDITLRALETLKHATLIAAEDTRHSRKLLERYGIETPLISLHEHNEEEQAPTLVTRMRGGESVALISDAGTPLLSDPGYRLVKLAAEAGIQVTPIPGASAVTAALCVCALPTDRFCFEGFLPAKSGARRTRLEKLKAEPRTQIFFESSHRIVAMLQDLADIFGAERQAAVCREMTKQFETVLRDDLGALAARVENEANQQRGEFVIVVAGHSASQDETVAAGLEMAQALLEFLPASQAAKVAARLTGAPRRTLYEHIGK
jgi:16S rRNA (cytidine1402-2'-O)-methyltransferase